MIHIVKRAEPGKAYSAAVRAASVVLALVTTALLLAFMGLNPAKVYVSMIMGSFASFYKFAETVKIAVPLLILSLGILIAFKMKYWNIGAEGQMFMGAFAASYFALFHSNWPPALLLPVMSVAGFVAGGLWSLAAAVFNIKFGANETLLTLMLNYIAQKWIVYVQFYLWKDPSSFGFPKIANFSQNAILPKFLGIHIGWVIALVLVALVYMFLHKTKMGYEISVVGDSPNTARYAGMNIARIMLVSLFISGGLCGLAGMIQASAVSQTLNTEVTGGMGFTAIITAWLSGLKEPALVAVAFLFSVLVQGASNIQIIFKIPQAAALILQGMILFFVLGGEFFVNYKVAFRPKTDNGGHI